MLKTKSTKIMKLVIAGSTKLQDEIQKWIEYWNSKDGYSVLDYPKIIPQNNFENLYPDVHKNFFKNMQKPMLYLLLTKKRTGSMVT